MKTKILVSIMLLLALGLFATGVYAHGNDPYYSGRGVKSEAQKIDKGIQITLTSDDPQIARQLQEDASYYETTFANGGYCCPHMGRTAQRDSYMDDHGCMW